MSEIRWYAGRNSLVNLLTGVLRRARKLGAQGALPAAASTTAAAFELLAERGDNSMGGVPLVLQHKHKLKVAGCTPG